MNGPTFTETRAVLLVDLHVRVGDMLNAFLTGRNAHNTSMYFFGVCDNQTELTWNLSMAEETLMASFEEKKKLPTSEMPRIQLCCMLANLPTISFILTSQLSSLESVVVAK